MTDSSNEPPVVPGASAPGVGRVELPEVDARPLLLDALMPSSDAARADHRIVNAPVAATFEAALRADLARATEVVPAVKALFAAREAGERAVSALRGRPFTLPEMDDVRLGGLQEHGEWVRLGADAPHEFAFGAIGRFWGGETTWREIDAADFGAFAEPGFARVAANMSFRPYGAERTLVSYECRTQATDPDSRRAFLRYWRALSPFIGVVLRAGLAVVADEAAG
jgi:hypothetical protein